MVIALLLLACQTAPSSTGQLAPVALLTRASLDLRGRRPSLEELAAVQQDPDAVDALVDAMVDDPDFGARIAMIYAHALQARADQGDHSDQRYAFSDVETLLTNMGEEPLRLIARIADEDLPWTEVTTGAWTMADPALATWYPVDWPDGATGWQPVAWTDGRPAAGLLSTNGLYWRFGSTDLNANRGRFNAVSRALLCQDYLTRPVSPPAELDLTDEEAVREAVQTVDACIGCHNMLDPAGAFMWGFSRQEPFSLLDLVSYHPQDELLWETDGIAPAYAGTPGDSLDDLGWMIADDPRLISCAVERAIETLWGRAPDLDDTATLDALRGAFIEGGLALRPLYAAVVATPAYRADPAVEGAVAWRIATPDLLVSQVAALTGFRPAAEQLDLWSTDATGLRSLAGAGRSLASDPPSVASPTAQVLQARLAEAAAAWLVGQGADSPQADALLGLVDLDDSAPAALDDQVSLLWLALLSRSLTPDDAEHAATVQLWQGLVADGLAPRDAWAGVLTALLRHPDLVVY